MNWSRFTRTLGPGILFASTAIGVSHLVQSTRAGAEFGFGLLWAIVLANVLKFPFFEYGSRYANVKKESIIDGYLRIGRWMLGLYFLITLASMWFVTAAVGAVTAGFLDNLFNLSVLIPQWTLFVPTLVFLAVILILSIGRYKLLDGIIKVIGITLLITTVIAFILTLFQGPQKGEQLWKVDSLVSGASIGYLIALMGWMPTAVDLSAWNSLWTIERIKQTNYHPTLKETTREFSLGYWISAGLSICFVTLGAYLIFGTGKELPDGSAAFSHAVVGLYTSSLGSWTYLIIASAAFSIMLGTCIGVFDGYARSLQRASFLLFRLKKAKHDGLYPISLIIVGLGAFIIVSNFGTSIGGLVKLAMTISFVIAPLIAGVNFYLVNSKTFPKSGKPSWGLKLLSWLGLLFLSLFSVLFILEKI